MTPARRGCLRLGTRGSALALAQSRAVGGALKQLLPWLELEEVIIRTRGDRETGGPVAPLGGKGVFVRELENALLAGEIDLAVHSLKDLPVDLPPGLEIAAVPERADPADALISGPGSELDQLRAGARVATGSPRRAVQLRLARPDLTCVPLRGNVDTRLRRLDEGAFDALILAVAGLVRLGRLDGRARRLDPERFVPAPGQGALALQARTGSEAAALARRLSHGSSETQARAEMALVRALGGGCQLPLGALGRCGEGRLTLTALLAHPDGDRWVRDREEGDVGEPEAVAQRLAERLRKAGGEEILRALAARGGAAAEAS